MDYSDIMDMDKPISHHKPMDITHRAKIFAPFAALKGFEDCIRQKEIVYEEYPVLSEEQKDRLDQKVQMIGTGFVLTVTYFVHNHPLDTGKGQIQTVTGEVIYWNPSRNLQIGQTEIQICDIIELSGDIFDGLEEPA